MGKHQDQTRYQLKADIDTALNILHSLFNKIWDEEKFLAE
jgi:hypothetical protein